MTATMDDMATESGAHARSKPASRADLWFVLILTGCTSAFLQMFHATHSGSTAGIVDVLAGLVPAATAIGLSHVVVSHKAATWLRVITVGVMLAFMAAAASASAAVVQPVEVKDFNWVFAFALDIAELVCVWLLLGDGERKAAEATAVNLAEQTAADARREAGEVSVKAERLEAELATVRAALEAERARRVPQRKPRRGSGRKPAGTGTRNRAPATAGSSGPELVPDEPLSIEAEARILELVGEGRTPSEARVLALMEEGNSASKAGVLAGYSDSYGRQVARLARPAKKEPAGNVRTDGDMATGEQPRVR